MQFSLPYDIQYFAATDSHILPNSVIREKTFNTNTICHVFIPYFDFQRGSLLKLPSLHLIKIYCIIKVEVKSKVNTMCWRVIRSQRGLRVLLCLRAFMCNSTTVLTPCSTSLTSPLSKALLLEQFFSPNLMKCCVGWCVLPRK